MNMKKFSMISMILPIAIASPSNVSPSELEEFTEKLVQALEKNPEILAKAQEKYFKQRSQGAEEKYIRNILKAIKKSPDIFKIPSCPRLGSAESKKVVHALVSPYCGYCQSFLKNILEKMKDNKDLAVNLILGGYEGHEGSKIAARAITAAALKGKLKEFLETFLQKVNMLEKEDLLTVAPSIGLKPEEFKEVYESQEVTDSLDGASKAISKLEINGFPTIIKEEITSKNGKKDYDIMLGLPPEEKIAEFFLPAPDQEK